ncbi:MAG: M23 family peptidase, partial [Spirochaetota bacterium]|nr:M23 family peptidase [Spirochaetota bacterium]
MSPANQYKRLEKKLFDFLSRIAAKAVSFIAENVKKVIDLGKQRFTVMLIPHSERKIFNFRISVFSLIFVG